MAEDRVASWLEERGRREVTQLLFLLWDPIGVADDFAAWREYESYADDVVRLAVAGRSTDEIARRLQEIAATEMEIETGEEPHVASTLARWIALSLHAWERGGRET